MSIGMVPITAGPAAAAAATAAEDSASVRTAGVGPAGSSLVVVEDTAPAGGVPVMAATTTICEVVLGEVDGLLTTEVCEDGSGAAKASGGVTRSTDDDEAAVEEIDDAAEGSVD